MRLDCLVAAGALGQLLRVHVPRADPHLACFRLLSLSLGEEPVHRAAKTVQAAFSLARSLSFKAQAPPQHICSIERRLAVPIDQANDRAEIHRHLAFMKSVNEGFYDLVARLRLVSLAVYGMQGTRERRSPVVSPERDSPDSRCTAAGPSPWIARGGGRRRSAAQPLVDLRLRIGDPPHQPLTPQQPRPAVKLTHPGCRTVCTGISGSKRVRCVVLRRTAGGWNGGACPRALGSARQCRRSATSC